jgi:phospholipase/carboxylesterase
MSTAIKTIERKPRVAVEGAPPLLILLHGYGADERDLFDLADYLDPRLYVVSARAPLGLPWGGFAWYHLGGQPGALVPDPQSRARAADILERFVEAVPARVGADPRRSYVLGFSQGAIMSLAVAARRPELVAGLISLSGYLDPETVPASGPAALGGLPILHMHGTYDDVIPVAAAHMTRDVLQQTDARYEYHEYPIAHGIHPDALGVIQAWLSARLDEPR